MSSKLQFGVQTLVWQKSVWQESVWQKSVQQDSKLQFGRSQFGRTPNFSGCVPLVLLEVFIDRAINQINKFFSEKLLPEHQFANMALKKTWTTAKLTSAKRQFGLLTIAKRQFGRLTVLQFLVQRNRSCSEHCSERSEITQFV